jgi:Mlc titration factor MtfA (ptsG expression regulator)
MAHQLDWETGSITGTPPMPGDGHARRWHAIMSAEFDHLRKLVESDRDSLLDPYALENEGEFFAMAVEYFFEQPALLRAHHPALYRLFSEYFGQDPAGWTGGAPNAPRARPIRRQRPPGLMRRR